MLYRPARVALTSLLTLLFMSAAHAEDPVRGPLPPLPSMACPLIEAAEAPKLDGNLE